jgi:hypothetical protein
LALFSEPEIHRPRKLLDTFGDRQKKKKKVSVDLESLDLVQLVNDLKH